MNYFVLVDQNKSDDDINKALIDYLEQLQAQVDKKDGGQCTATPRRNSTERQCATTTRRDSTDSGSSGDEEGSEYASPILASSSANYATTKVNL